MEVDLKAKEEAMKSICPGDSAGGANNTSGSLNEGAAKGFDFSKVPRCGAFRRRVAARGDDRFGILLQGTEIADEPRSRGAAIQRFEGKDNRLEYTLFSPSNCPRKWSHSMLLPLSYTSAELQKPVSTHLDIGIT